MGTERKLRMVLAKNDFSDALGKHTRYATTPRDKRDVAASALFVAAGYLGRSYGLTEDRLDEAMGLAATLLRENKIR